MKRLFDTRKEEKLQARLQELTMEYNKELILGSEEKANEINNEMQLLTKDRNHNDIIKLRINEIYQKYFTDEEFYKDYIKGLEKFVEIARTENLELSISPHSDSIYATLAGEEIGWGHKPEGSYRFSDHWNWGDWDNPHCPSKEIGYEEVAVGKFINGLYHKIQGVTK